jgi:hypothetical protein
MPHLNSHRPDSAHAGSGLCAFVLGIGLGGPCPTGCARGHSLDRGRVKAGLGQLRSTRAARAPSSCLGLSLCESDSGTAVRGSAVGDQLLAHAAGDLVLDIAGRLAGGVGKLSDEELAHHFVHA